MAVYGWSLTGGAANVKMDGLTSVTLDNLALTKGDTITEIRDGKLVVESISVRDSKQRNRGYAVKAEATWKYMSTPLANIQAIAGTYLCGDNSYNIIPQNGENFIFGLTGAGGGCVKSKLVIDGDFDADRHIEMGVKMHRIISGLDAGFGTFTPSGGISTGLTAGSPSASGFATISVKKTGEAAEPLGTIRKGKLTAEVLCTEGNLKQYVAHAMKIDAEVEVLETLSANLLLIDSILSAANNGIVLATPDNITFTFTNELGIDIGWHLESDANDIAFLKVTASGIIPLASWSALVS